MRNPRPVVTFAGVVVVVAAGLGTLTAVRPDAIAVHVTNDADGAESFRAAWPEWSGGAELVVIESPYRALVGPLTAYLDVLDLAWPPDKDAPITIVVLPEFVARHWWDRLLYNQSAKRLKSALVGREHTVIADVPYRRGH